METLSIWNTLYPSLISLPVEWDHKMPYGILYSKHPSKQVQEFIDSIRVLKLN